MSQQSGQPSYDELALLVSVLAAKVEALGAEVALLCRQLSGRGRGAALVEAGRAGLVTVTVGRDS